MRHSLFVLLFLTVLVALLHATGGFPAIWHAVAYQRLGDAAVPVPYALEKRWSWLPGPQRLYPSQECLMCYYANRPAEFIALRPLLRKRGKEHHLLVFGSSGDESVRQLLKLANPTHADCSDRYNYWTQRQPEYRRRQWHRLIDTSASPAAPESCPWYISHCACEVCR
ncbi:MAG: hypothetical protein AAF581_19060 [Planctomycetota bacterium]